MAMVRPDAILRATHATQDPPVKFSETKLAGAYLITPELLTDGRGFFARSFCQEEFAQHGLDTRTTQCNISYNEKRNTLRGMHYQIEPYGEVKLVRCTRGEIFDVIVDLRPDSPTKLQWYGVNLTAENRHMLYIPAGFAHGFQTLTDHAEVFYQMSTLYMAHAARGVPWNDPDLGIDWPEAQHRVISVKDQSLTPIADG